MHFIFNTIFKNFFNNLKTIIHMDRRKWYSVSFCVRIIQRRTSQGGQHQLEQSTTFSLYRQIRTSLKRGSSNHVAIMRSMQRALNIRRAPWCTQSSLELKMFNCFLATIWNFAELITAHTMHTIEQTFLKLQIWNIVELCQIA